MEVTSKSPGAAQDRQEQAGSDHLDSHFLRPEVRGRGGNIGRHMRIRIEAGPLLGSWDLADPTGSGWSWSLLRDR